MKKVILIIALLFLTISSLLFFFTEGFPTGLQSTLGLSPKMDICLGLTLKEKTVKKMFPIGRLSYSFYKYDVVECDQYDPDDQRVYCRWYCLGKNFGWTL